VLSVLFKASSFLFNIFLIPNDYKKLYSIFCVDFASILGLSQENDLERAKENDFIEEFRRLLGGVKRWEKYFIFLSV